MSCKCSYNTDEFHGYGCTVSGGACAFLIPDSIACAIEYQEGPDSDKTLEELETLKDQSPMYQMAKRMAERAEMECDDNELMYDDYDDYYEEE